MFTKAWNNPLIKIALMFATWRIATFLFAAISVGLVPLRSHDFLGGTYDHYSQNPLFWGWGNFDGEHYFSIARDGYLPLTYFYFPLYPILIKILAIVFGGSFTAYAISGLLLSNLFLIIALVGIYKLGKLFYNEKSAFFSILLLLAFPTAFFLGSFYNDSLFLALAVWSL